jgi:hypothetical protein
MKRSERSLFAPLVLAMVVAGHQDGFATAHKVLSGVFEPETIRVAAGRLYVVEGASVLVYSLKDLSLVTRIGRQGEGPGEFKETDYWYNTVTVLPDHIFVDGYDKAARFSKDGRLLGEMKKPVGISKMVPVGANYAGLKLEHIEGERQYQCLYLLDGNLRFKRELCRQESPVQQLTRTIEMIPDVLNFTVWDDRVFVEKSREGLVIDVFDSEGVTIGRIEHESERIRPTQEHKARAVEDIKSDPFVKRMGYEAFASLSRFVWPDALPAITDFVAADGKLYVRTPGTLEGRERWLVMDQEGRVTDRVLLPPVGGAPLMARLYGVSYHAIDQGTLYFIKDDEATDEWELHAAEIR